MFKIKSIYKYDELIYLYGQLKDRARIDNSTALVDYTPYFYSPRNIILATERIISSHQELIDKFGFVRYLQEDGKSLYLIDSYPIRGLKTTASSAYYVQKLTGEIDVNLEMIINALQSSQQENIIEKIKSMPADKEEIFRLLGDLNNQGKVEFIEWALLDVTQNPVAEIIRNIFSFYIFVSGDPVKLTDRVKQQVIGYKSGVKKKGRPRKKGNEALMIFEDEDFANQQNYLNDDIRGTNVDNRVILHNFTGVGQEQTSYSKASAAITGHRTIRIYKVSEREWRNLASFEESVFSQLVTYLLKIKLKVYENTELYGIILDGGDFRVVNKLDLESTKDKRKNKRGRVCKTWPINELIRFLHHQRVEAPGRYNSVSTAEIINYLSAKKIDRAILANMSEEDLLFYYKWYMFTNTAQHPRPILCEYLFESFKQDKLLVVT
jgi:hypothetical protein